MGDIWDNLTGQEVIIISGGYQAMLSAITAQDKGYHVYWQEQHSKITNAFIIHYKLLYSYRQDYQIAPSTPLTKLLLGWEDD
jgi:hypothetical protein